MSVIPNDRLFISFALSIHPHSTDAIDATPMKLEGHSTLHSSVIFHSYTTEGTFHSSKSLGPNTFNGIQCADNEVRGFSFRAIPSAYTSGQR